MRWSERLCLRLNACFPKPPNPGGRESVAAYQDMQFHKAETTLKLYQQYMDFTEKNVVDLGCGMGGKTVYYALHSGARSVLGLDVLEALLPLAIEFAQRQQAEQIVRFQMNAVAHLALENNSVDIVISNDAMEHVAEPRSILQECHRILKPGGVVCIDFGPLYYSYKGAHIYDYIAIPWCQLVFSQQTLINVIRSMPSQPHLFGHQRTVERLQELNKLTAPQFRAMVNELPFQIVHWEIGRERSFKSLPVYPLSFLPVIGKLFIHSVNCILRKP